LEFLLFSRCLVSPNTSMQTYYALLCAYQSFSERRPSSTLYHSVLHPNYLPYKKLCTGKCVENKPKKESVENEQGGENCNIIFACGPITTICFGGLLRRCSSIWASFRREGCGRYQDGSANDEVTVNVPFWWVSCWRFYFC
jgi:hypothetical protein